MLTLAKKKKKRKKTPPQSKSSDSSSDGSSDEDEAPEKSKSESPKPAATPAKSNQGGIYYSISLLYKCDYLRLNYLWIEIWYLSL